MFTSTKQHGSKSPVESKGEPAVDFPTATFCDVSVNAMTLDGFRRALTVGIQTGQKWLIAHHNLHSLYLWHKGYPHKQDAALHSFYKRAKWTQVDGMSMVLLARLHGHAIRRSHRIAFNVVLPSLLKLAEVNGWRVFYLGSSPAISAQGSEALRTLCPELQLEVHHGYFSPEASGRENQEVLEKIALFSPQILFVGMGMPRQEQWVHENYEAIRANIILTSGATLDYFAGALRIPPRWMSSTGLEWVFRLYREPSRLYFRYLVEPWITVGNLLKRRFVKRRISVVSEQEATGA